MKKTFTSILTICVVCMSVVMALSACSGADSYKYEDADKYTVGGGALDLGLINNIDVSWVLGEVSIVTGDVPQVTFEETAEGEIDESLKIRYWLSGTTLKIKFASSLNVPRTFSLAKKLTITIPNSTAKVFTKVRVDSVSSAVSFNGISATNADIVTVSGNISVVGGKISEKLEAESVSGNVSVNNAEIQRFNVDTTSGKVTLSTSLLPSIANIETVSGAVDFVFPLSASFILEFDTVNGRFSSDFASTRQGNKYVIGSGRNTYDVETTSGDLSILQSA